MIAGERQLMYLHYMRIVWDEPKRQTNLRERQLDFADLDLSFFASASVNAAKRGRLMATGEFRGIMLTVIFVPLGSEAISIISMRPASRRERRQQ